MNNTKVREQVSRRYTPTDKIVGKIKSTLKNTSEKIVGFAKPKSSKCQICRSIANMQLLLSGMGGLPGSDIVTLLCNVTVYYIMNLINKLGKHWKLEENLRNEFNSLSAKFIKWSNTLK